MGDETGNGGGAFVSGSGMRDRRDQGTSVGVGVSGSVRGMWRLRGAMRCERWG